jgi:hypothetical protein
LSTTTILRANGHLVAEVPLQPPAASGDCVDPVLEKWQNHDGGIQILQARDLNHAVQLLSELPGFKYGLGPVEIRPVADLNEMMKESEQRRRKAAR